MQLKWILVIAVLFFSIPVYAANNTNSFYTAEKPNISVASDQPQFVIKLKSNPSTGYSWFLRDYNANLITPIKREIDNPTKNSPIKIVGAPVYEIWTFKVNAAAFIVPQQTTLKLAYARPWENLDQVQPVTFAISTFLK